MAASFGSAVANLAQDLEDLEPLEIPELDFEFQSLLLGGYNEGPALGSVSNKRDYQTAFDHEQNELPGWIGTIYPSFLPSIPIAEPSQLLLNPCLDNRGQPYPHPFLRPSSIPRVQREEEELNSWIKVRFVNSKWDQSLQQNNRFAPLLQSRPPPSEQTSSSAKRDPLKDLKTSYLPKHFGSVVLKDNIDRQLHRFYILAFCSGRTIIESRNCYRMEIAPIAARSDFVKHAMLALAASYFLDFQKGAVLADRAMLHNNQAMSLLSTELASVELGIPGKEESLIAGIILLMLNEIVNWEGTSGHRDPIWYKCGEIARRVLDASDPGARYHLPKNIQSTLARQQLAGVYTSYNLFSDCFYPLDLELKKCQTAWLLSGTELEQRKILPEIGASPKLIHYFAKVTFLSSRLFKNPKSQVTLKVADAVSTALDGHYQWSELSTFYPNPSDILEQCPLDEHGFVSTPGEVIDLVAFTHLAAAKIYLHCRAFRRPAQYRPVQILTDQLLRAVQMMPDSGPLLTAMWPLFPFFFAAIVAFKEEHRAFIRFIYASFCTIARGNLTPTWTAIQHIWEWMDENQRNVDAGDDGSWLVADANPWWEDMVEDLASHSGRINLA